MRITRQVRSKFGSQASMSSYRLSTMMGIMAFPKVARMHDPVKHIASHSVVTVRTFSFLLKAHQLPVLLRVIALSSLLPYHNCRPFELKL